MVSQYGRFLASFVTIALFGVVAYGGELDGKRVKAPAMIIKKIDPETSTATSYKVDVMPEGMTEADLSKLSKEERAEKIAAFIKTVEKKENIIAEEQVEKVDVAKIAKSELAKETSTAACGWRWRGRFSGGYYGYGFRGYYGAGYVNYGVGWGYGAGCGYYGGGNWGGGYYGNSIAYGGGAYYVAYGNGWGC